MVQLTLHNADVDGNLNVDGDTTLNGNTTIGDAIIDLLRKCSIRT